MFTTPVSSHNWFYVGRVDFTYVGHCSSTALGPQILQYTAQYCSTFPLSGQGVRSGCVCNIDYVTKKYITSPITKRVYLLFVTKLTWNHDTYDTAKLGFLETTWYQKCARYVTKSINKYGSADQSQACKTTYIMLIFALHSFCKPPRDRSSRPISCCTTRKMVCNKLYKHDDWVALLGLEVPSKCSKKVKNVKFSV